MRTRAIGSMFRNRTPGMAELFVLERNIPAEQGEHHVLSELGIARQHHVHDFELDLLLGRTLPPGHFLQLLPTLYLPAEQEADQDEQNPGSSGKATKTRTRDKVTPTPACRSPHQRRHSTSLRLSAEARCLLSRRRRRRK